MPGLVERPRILLHSQALKPDGSGANELVQPANDPQWHLYCRACAFALSVESVTGSPTTWSLGLKFQRANPDVPNTTTNSGYQFAKKAWVDLQAEETTNLIEQGIGWYAGTHTAPVDGDFGIVADQTDSPSAGSPILVHRTMCYSGQAARVVFDVRASGGTSPTVIVSLSATPIVA